MGEISDDHYVALSWDGGLGLDDEGYPLAPPTSVPSTSGGLDAHFARVAAQAHRNKYRCKFCSSLIGFVDRKPYNLMDGSPHRCLTEGGTAGCAQGGGSHG